MCMHIHMNMCVYTYIYTHVYVCEHACMHMCVHVCRWKHIHIYVYRYICIYVCERAKLVHSIIVCSHIKYDPENGAQDADSAAVTLKAKEVLPANTAWQPSIGNDSMLQLELVYGACHYDLYGNSRSG